MPYNRPGNIFYTTNATGGTINHGQLVVSEGRVGVAIKQKNRAWSDAAPAVNTPLTIANGEDFAMAVKGVVQVANAGTGSPYTVGGAIYITSANVVTSTSTGNNRVGRVVEIAGERGTPTGLMRVDLDAKDSLAPAP